VPDNFDIM